MIAKNEQEKAFEVLTNELKNQISLLNDNVKNCDCFSIYKICENVYILTDLLIEMTEIEDLSFLDEFFDIVERYNIDNHYVDKIANLFI